MTIEDRIKNWQLHPSQRGWFSLALYKAMAKNENIFLLMGDLGWGIFDNHIQDFPKRAISVGASEQSMLDIAIGLALKDKIPFCYSITSFLLWRGAETIRLYLDHENIPVKLIGSGRDKDYDIDGFSHDASDVKQLLKSWPNIVQFWPDEKDEIPDMVKEMVNNRKPSFISLKR